MTENVIFGSEEDNDEEQETISEAEEQTKADKDEGVESKEDSTESQEESSTEEEDVGQEGKGNEEETEEVVNVKEVFKTLGPVSGKNRSFQILEWKEASNINSAWISFDSEASEIEKDEMEQRLKALQDNKDAWNKPIKIKIINKGTVDDPEFRFVDYEIPSEDEVPEDFEPVESDYNKGSDSSSQSSEEGKMGSMKYDKIISALQKATKGYNVDTELVKSEQDFFVVKATISYVTEDDKAFSTEAYGTSKDSNVNQKLEHAETRAFKRAVKHSGLLKKEVEE